MSAADENHLPLPAIVSTSDLFDGEIFGDELLDIYHSTLGDDHHNEDASMGDGLGAFRPSTSFNDLTTLLDEEDGNHSVEEGKSGKRRRANTADAPSSSKKRAGASKVTEKRPATKKPPSTVSATFTAESDESRAVTPREVKADTPNPLPLLNKVKTAPMVPTLNITQGSSLDLDIDDKESISEDDDFKTIAQAAVSNLIMNAGKPEATATTSNELDPADVDTSTAHIKALTGNNWVTACAGAASGVSSNSTVSSAENGKNNMNNNNRSRRQNMTPDERARQNRDRNREHARNTRLRKKAYVEELKRTLVEMVNQRDAAEFEKRQSIQREAEQREVRYRVIEEFLKLRGRNETNAARWSAILEDGFTLTIPKTGFRQMVKAANSFSEQVITGVEECMEDSCNLSTFLQSFAVAGNDEKVYMNYGCDRKDFFMDGCLAVLEWTATVPGVNFDFQLKGSFRGKFSPASNKLLSAIMLYDTGALLAQFPNKNTSAVHSNEAAVAAAEAAASQAGAILDSLEMPEIAVSIPVAVNVVPCSNSSASEAEKEDGSMSDDPDAEHPDDKKIGMTTRRVQRRVE